MQSTKKNVPVASPVESVPAEDIEIVEEETLDMVSFETLKESLKGLEIHDILALIKFATVEAEKKAKAAGLKNSNTKKKGSAPKGVSPPQLAKPRAWVEFAHKYALENGWESFVCTTKKKNKKTEEVTIEQIVMPASVLVDECWVYEGSSGKQPIHKEAMSLSKTWWSPKENTGTRPDIYQLFEAQYVPPVVAESSSSETSNASSSVVRLLTAAEKEAEKEAKKAAKEAEKEAKKAAKEAEKEAKKAEKDAEKAKKKAEKDATKPPKKTVEKKPTGPIKASAVASTKKVETTPIPAPTPTPTPTPKPLQKKSVKKDDWLETCPNDDNVYPWTFMGNNYFRNYSNEVWEDDDGSLGAWAGKFDFAAGKIDDSAPEPGCDDDEE